MENLPHLIISELVCWFTRYKVHLLCMSRVNLLGMRQKERAEESVSAAVVSVVKQPKKERLVTI